MIGSHVNKPNKSASLGIGNVPCQTPTLSAQRTLGEFIPTATLAVPATQSSASRRAPTARPTLTPLPSPRGHRTTSASTHVLEDLAASPGGRRMCVGKERRGHVFWQSQRVGPSVCLCLWAPLERQRCTIGNVHECMYAQPPEDCRTSNKARGQKFPPPPS